MYNKIKNIVPHKIKVNNYQAKLLDSGNVAELQKFFENNSEFFIASTSSVAKSNEAEAVLKMNENNFPLGLLDGAEIIAFAELFYNGNEWSLGKYLVDSNRRGQGIASKFLNSIEDMLLNTRAETLNAKMTEGNVCVVSFLEKSGFKVVDKKDDVISFSKKLERKEPSIEDKYFKGGKLVNFPSKPNEQQEVYRIMSNWFEKNKKYSEPEINEIIKSKIETRDHATFRRDLVDNHFLNRGGDGKEYWV